MPKRKKAESEGSAPRFAKEQLASFVERIERLTEEKAGITGDIKCVYDEAGSVGYDKKALRAVIRLRAQDAAERAELEAMVETYMAALGELASTPLGLSAVDRYRQQLPAQSAVTSA